MEAYYGQVLFIVGIIIPLLAVCFLRWVCKTRAARRTSGTTPQGTAAPAPTYQEVESLPRTLSYFDPPNGEPPPTYESIQQIPESQTLTYIDEYGNAKHVKWDGGASIPTRTALGNYNPAFLIDGDSTEGESVEGNIDVPEQNQVGTDTIVEAPLTQESETTAQVSLERNTDVPQQDRVGADTVVQGPLAQESESSAQVSLERNTDVPQQDRVGVVVVEGGIAQETVNVDTNVGDSSMLNSHGDTHGTHGTRENKTIVEQTANVELVEDTIGMSVERQESSTPADQVT